MLEISFAGAAAAGLLSFFTPCILPMVPFYLSYMAGISMQELRGDGAIAPGAQRRGAGRQGPRPGRERHDTRPRGPLGQPVRRSRLPRAAAGRAAGGGQTARTGSPPGTRRNWRRPARR